LLDFGVSFADVFGAEAGLDGNVFVRASDPRADDAVATVERFAVTAATLARRLSVVYSVNEDKLKVNVAHTRLLSVGFWS